jgi:hypothetical protein
MPEELLGLAAPFEVSSFCLGGLLIVRRLRRAVFR